MRKQTTITAGLKTRLSALKSHGNAAHDQQGEDVPDEEEIESAIQKYDLNRVYAASKNEVSKNLFPCAAFAAI